MNILALESSTTTCGAALLRDGQVLAESQWEVIAPDNQRLLRVVQEILANAGVQPSDIGCFAVDSGPGRFTGLRTAMSLACGMAVPGRVPVIGIDSGSAIAWQIWRAGAAGTVAVAGDARRNRLWIARFGDGPKGPVALAPYTSVPTDEAPGLLERGDHLVSPDSASIAGVLGRVAEEAGASFATEPCRPAARTIGHLASIKMAAGETVLPTIVYIHPPV